VTRWQGVIKAAGNQRGQMGGVPEKEKKKARAGGSRRSRNYISFKYTKLLYSLVKNNHVINILYCV
jgi:hypothetical protein